MTSSPAGSSTTDRQTGTIGPSGRATIRVVATWDTFAVVCGAAAAALLGLLFVAISIRIDVIAPSVELRNRAGQTLVLFSTALIVSILLSLPDQSYQAFGAELLALAAVSTAGMVWLDRRAAGAASGVRIARALDAVTPTALACGLLFVAGALLVFGVPAGLYVLVAPILAAFIGGVTSAWLLMTRVTE